MLVSPSAWAEFPQSKWGKDGIFGHWPSSFGAWIYGVLSNQAGVHLPRDIVLTIPGLNLYEVFSETSRELNVGSLTIDRCFGEER